MLFVALAALLLPTSASAQDNLITNPSFEDAREGRPVGWHTRPGEEPVTLRDDGGRTGDRYVRFTDTSPTAGIMLESLRIPARPGGTYRATAWFRTEDECSPGIYLNFYDDLDVRVHHLFTRVTGPTDGWVIAEVTAVAPEDAILVSTALYAYAADVGVFDADDVTMTVEGGGEPGRGLIPKAEPGDKTMIDIGSRLELFVDEFMLDAMTGEARRWLHHPIRRETVLQFDRPWEGAAAGYVSVMVEEGRIRLYYRGWPAIGGRENTCVAESQDGINFTRPNLGLFEWEGDRDNNIIWMGAGSHNFTPFLDTNPAAPDHQRYKALASAGPNASLVAFASPDGYRWEKIQEEPVITVGAFDSQNLAFWDPLREQYVEYHRGFRDGVRDIMTSTSPDFINWTEPRWLSYGDAPREHLYTNAIAPYFRAPHIYLGFPNRFVPGRKKVAEHEQAGMNDGVLMSSRDGLNFERWREAFLRPAADPFCWTDRNNYIAWQLAPTSDTELSLYWNEHYRRPTHRLVRGTVRMDGFVSVNSGAIGGEILTRPFTFEGSNLVVNYSTSAVGMLQFELCDEAGEAYPGFALADSERLFGDDIAHVVHWTGGPDVSSLAGQPVRLRVKMRDADLYSFQFRP